MHMFEPLVASVIVAACSLIGVFFFRNSGRIVGAHRFILPFAIGVFLGIVFLELIPETLSASPEYGAYAILGGFFLFYLLSHVLTTYHHHHHGEHEDDCVPSGGRMLLVGDTVHNIADGIIITSAFLVDPTIGVMTTAGVVLHELPQEVAEFGVLLASGYSRSRALALNLLSATGVIFGTLVTLAFASYAVQYVWVLLGIAAGNLLYIATSDLIPELLEGHRTHFYKIFAATLAGVFLISFTLILAHEYIDAETIQHAEPLLVPNA